MRIAQGIGTILITSILIIILGLSIYFWWWVKSQEVNPKIDEFPIQSTQQKDLYDPEGFCVKNPKLCK